MNAQINDIRLSGPPASSYHPSNIDVDPMWADSSHHLAFNSPLKTAGDPLYAPLYDMDNQLRTAGTAPIGPDGFAPVIYALDTRADGSVPPGGVFSLRAVMDPGTTAYLFYGFPSPPLMIPAYGTWYLGSSPTYLLNMTADPITGYAPLLDFTVPTGFFGTLGTQVAFVNGSAIQLSNMVPLSVR